MGLLADPPLVLSRQQVEQTHANARPGPPGRASLRIPHVGHRLTGTPPTGPGVVEALAINPNTVLKAYRELEREGLVAGRRGLGTFVRRSLGEGRATDARLRSELTTWMAQARAEGLEKDDITALFTAVLETLDAEQHGPGAPDSPRRTRQTDQGDEG
ncbi:GntR family transcriptional regulator [Streptomyces sp. NPDC058290]|uniref:GntR family transcriptional regulator n=1 Tax=Streptomyces sp. NPDC058290 TaxID=3346426 RepID=UPI0036E7CD7D